MQYSLIEFNCANIILALPNNNSCVSTIPPIPLNLPGKTTMFNCEEVKFLFDLLRNETPQLSLVTGPVNSGKSMLVHHIIEKLTTIQRTQKYYHQT